MSRNQKDRIGCFDNYGPDVRHANSFYYGYRDFGLVDDMIGNTA